MKDLSELQDAIKAKLSISLAQVDAPQLQLYTNSNRDQLINTWDFLNSLPQEYFDEGGYCSFIYAELNALFVTTNG
jgi:hypothetical protein